MKAKLSLDKATIKEFFLQHSEKIVLGVFVVCFLLVVYSAWGRESFDRTSDQLLQDAQRAQQHIEDTAADAADLDDNLLKASESVESGPVQVKDYQWALAWDRPMFTTGGKRGESKIFPVEALRATAGVGAFRMTSADGGQAGKRWVVVTGLVPIEKQELAMIEAFETAEHYDPETVYTISMQYSEHWAEACVPFSSSSAASAHREQHSIVGGSSTTMCPDNCVFEIKEYIDHAIVAYLHGRVTKSARR